MVLIDDDKIANVINRKIVERFYSDKAEIQQYTSAWDGLDYINRISASEGLRITVLLDINMPEMNGWEFLEEVSREFNQLSIAVHILSSSVDPEDRKTASNFSVVKSFISKPLSKEKVENNINY